MTRTMNRSKVFVLPAAFVAGIDMIYFIGTG
jgi:hypothetical protein